MAKFNTKQEDPADSYQSFSSKCHMPGCPLSGTMSDNTRGAGPFWCSYHFSSRNPQDFRPEIKDQLDRIAYAYNSGKRNYGGSYLETHREMLDRKREELKLAK